MAPKRLCKNVVQWHHNNQFKANLTASCLGQRHANHEFYDENFMMTPTNFMIDEFYDDTHEFYDDTHFNTTTLC